MTGSQYQEDLRGIKNNVTGKAAAKLVISSQTFHTRGAILGRSHFDSLDSIGGAAFRRSSSLESHYSTALPRCQSGRQQRQRGNHTAYTRMHAHCHYLHPASSCCNRSLRRLIYNYQVGDRVDNIRSQDGDFSWDLIPRAATKDAARWRALRLEWRKVDFCPVCVDVH